MLAKKRSPASDCIDTLAPSNHAIDTRFIGSSINSDTQQFRSHKELVDHYIQTIGLRERDRINDPAERLDFSRAPTSPISRINRWDVRSDAELIMALTDDNSPLERQRAAWELADRSGRDCADTLVSSASAEKDPRVRWSLLWLLQKHAGEQLNTMIEPFLSDPDPEVRHWVKTLVGEIRGLPIELGDERPLAFDDDNPFDQTLPLVIEGFGLIYHPNEGWLQATFSPIWFESIVGRVMACTIAKTFDKRLIIEKRINKFHIDGNDHYEIYDFRGFTFTPTPYVAHHSYYGIGNHTFYPSGHLEDPVLPPLDDVIVSMNRTAATLRVPIPLTAAAERRLNGHVVHSVRGRWMGAAFLNPSRLMNPSTLIGPGEIQLSNLHHPIAGPLTNAFIFGTFKGKLSDIDGDGRLDINTEYCHGTPNGQLDYELIGSPNPDPFDPFRKI